MKTQPIRIRTEDYKRLMQYKKEVGLPIAETIHRAVDEYLTRMNTQEALMEQFRNFDNDQLIQMLKQLREDKE